MSITQAQYIEILTRQSRNKVRESSAPISNAVKREMKLHDEIISYCNDQWPRWKYIRARPDQASTIQKGAQDFTIFLPGGKTLCVECKSAIGKLSSDQTAWKKEMDMLGHIVHEIRSMDEFLALLP